jgi:hypothetical protein
MTTVITRESGDPVSAGVRDYWPGTCFAVQFSAGCTANRSGFDYDGQRLLGQQQLPTPGWQHSQPQQSEPQQSSPQQSQPQPQPHPQP